MAETINPWLPLADDTALWGNLSLKEKVRREIILRFAEGEIAVSVAAEISGQEMAQSAFATRNLTGGDYLIPSRFAPIVDFFMTKKEISASAATSQEAALTRMLEGANLIVTGGPGTGKSHLIATFIAKKQTEVRAVPLRITIAAPTGKAAARFQHLKTETQTIHRFLGMGASGKPQYHGANPAPYDIVIVDEISMVDQGLFAMLVTALPRHAQLILAGDLNQLPAVEGRPIEPTIRFLTEQKLIGHAELKETYRFSRAKADAYAAIAATGLGKFSEDTEGLSQMQMNRPGEFSVFLENYAKEYFCSKTAIALRQKLGTLSEEEITESGILKEAFTLLKTSILLTELREGMHGSREIARRLEALVRKFSPEHVISLTPIIATANNYALSIFNGDTGLLFERNGEKTAVFEIFGEGFRFLSLPRLQGYESAYALTIHKSQGSEYENVFVLHDPKRAPATADHRLLYTAVTRARQRATVITF